MHSKTSTIILAVLALGFGTLAGVHIAQDDLSSIFGALPRGEGAELYEFDPAEVHTVSITNSIGEQAIFKKQGQVWYMHEPIIDRADFRDLQRIVYFSRHLRVADVIRRQEISLEESGMRRTTFHRGRFLVELTDRDGEQVAKYRLGRRTAWHQLDQDSGEASPTFFVRPNEKAQKDFIYICSAPGAIRPSVRQILDRGFDNLRDHRPFLFDPATLADVTIRRAGVEITLSRSETGMPWRMTKPLESRTKPETMAGLLKGLYELQAVKVHDAGAVTIPPRPPGAYFLELELRHFDSKGKRQERSMRLTVEPPLQPDAETVYATMGASRPSVVFELPFQPARGRFAITQLPVEVDQLRSRTLASLDIRNLRTITLHHLALRDPIEIFLGSQARGSDRSRRWMVNFNGEIAPVNEIALAELLQAVSRQEVLGFASDAARDLRNFGLSPPQKRLVLTGGTDEVIDLFFGQGQDGRYYAMRRGASTVAEISGTTFAAIAARPFDWRDTLLMPFSIVDLAVMRIERPVEAPLLDPALVLNYSFLDESWTARQYGEDATPRLNTQRANFLIQAMENLRVDKWLGDTSPVAQRALQKPSFRFTALFRKLNAEGDRTGLREATFELAPASRSAANRYFYGRLEGDSHYFVIGLDTYQLLTGQLMDRE